MLISCFHLRQTRPRPARAHTHSHTRAHTRTRSCSITMRLEITEDQVPRAEPRRRRRRSSRCIAEQSPGMKLSAPLTPGPNRAQKTRAHREPQAPDAASTGLAGHSPPRNLLDLYSYFLDLFLFHPGIASLARPSGKGKISYSNPEFTSIFAIFSPVPDSLGADMYSPRSAFLLSNLC